MGARGAAHPGVEYGGALVLQGEADFNSLYTEQ